MSNFSFNKMVATTIANVPVVAGTSDVVCTAVDCLDASAVQMCVSFGTITSGAVTSVLVHGSNDNSAFTALTGLSTTVADTYDDTIVLVEDNNPKWRYYRITVDRGTQNAVINLAWVNVLKNHVPVTQPASISTSTLGYGVLS